LVIDQIQVADLTLKEKLLRQILTSTDFGFVLLGFLGGQIYNLDILDTKIRFE